MTDWPHEGPSATLEVLQSIHGLGLALTNHHGPVAATIRGSLGSDSVLEAHNFLCQTLELAVQYDRLNVTVVASLELVTGCLVMIERAVKLNPKSPVFCWVTPHD